MANILFTAPSPFNPRLGGVESVTTLLCESLQKRGHAVYYFHHRNRDFYENYKSPAQYFMSPSTHYGNQENVDFYSDLIKRLEIDVVINQWGLFGDSELYNSVYNEKSSPLVLSVIHNDPILNYDTLWYEISRVREFSIVGLLKCIARIFLFPKIQKQFWKERKNHFQWLCNHTHRVVLLSSAHIDSLQRLGCWEMMKEKISVIPNPCAYVPADAYVKYKKKQVIYVGRLENHAKQPHRLARIWKHITHQFPDWELVFCGDGAEKEALERFCKRMGNVRFAGRVNPEDYYKTASILCLVSDFEGFPMVLPEAMSYGVVPIAYNSFAAYPDIVENEKEGIHVTPFDEVEFTSKLKELMIDESKRRALARAAIEKSRQFSLDKIVDEWELLINDKI